ncbi:MULTISPECIES: hypothetical protein [Cyanophyceae]|uniref:hypothetical protein n=1 Tax=Cyanophyceae TaxID=3028117 RepID=UPI001686DB29|nr:hypothetical protein [Trichocoleus sp. FACHB-40]MBD2006715.1 hypothetical protein [Trichocoleus sp. FACHB-40]
MSPNFSSGLLVPAPFHPSQPAQNQENRAFLPYITLQSELQPPDRRKMAFLPLKCVLVTAICEASCDRAQFFYLV